MAEGLLQRLEKGFVLGDGGYLMAFPMAAALCGWIAGREGRLLRTTVAFLVGTVVIFALGAAWLSVVTDAHSGALFATAVTPFLPGAVLKIGIGVGVARLVLARSART